jgi:hypothetical protein
VLVVVEAAPGIPVTTGANPAFAAARFVDRLMV